MLLYNDVRADFIQGNFYHIICKSINKNLLFSNDNNRAYFLKKYQLYLASYTDTYAWCLMNNHVHWLIKIKAEKDITTYLRGVEDKELTITQRKFISEEPITLDELLERQYNSFFVSYTRSYNIMYTRKGNLFDRAFKRIAITDDGYLTQAIVYIHANTVKHGIMKDFAGYKWSSYQIILSQLPTSLKRQEVLQWFGGKDKFIEIHQQQLDYYYDFKIVYGTA
jgi:putative transposase